MRWLWILVSLGSLSAQAVDPGELDPTFGEGGLVSSDIGTALSWGSSVSRQANGKLLLGGYQSSLGRVARLEEDGALDFSFGDQGWATVPRMSAMEVQEDGAIVILGEEFHLYRLLENGELDLSFGDQGSTAPLLIPGFRTSEAIAIQPDGKIVVVGSHTNNFALARFHSDGSPDLGFGEDGVVMSTFPLGADECFGVAVQTDGKLVAIGNVGSLGTSIAIRYHTDGSIDETFGMDGITDLGINASPTDILLLDDGRFLISSAGNSEGFLCMIDATGMLDDTFGIDGKVTLSSNRIGPRPTTLQTLDGQAFACAFEGGSAVYTFDLDGEVQNHYQNTETTSQYSSGYFLLDPSGAFFLAGRSTVGDLSAFSLSKVLSDGTLDESFGQSGIAKHVARDRGDNILRHVAQRADGKLMAVGNADTDFFVIVQYLPDGSLDTSFADRGYLRLRHPITPAGIVVDELGRLTLHYRHQGLCLERYLEDGERDLTFGESGVVQIEDDNNDVGTDLLLDSLGRYYVTARSSSEIMLYRITESGTLDATFSDAGRFTIGPDAIHTVVRGQAIALEPSGKLLLAYGQFDLQLAHSEARLVRLDAAGALDTTFGNGGTASVALSNRLLGPKALAFQESGRILIAVDAVVIFPLPEDQRELPYESLLFAFTPNGAPDETFGNDGVAKAIMGTGAISSDSLCVQANNKIIVSGSRHREYQNEAVVQRLLPDGQIDISWGAKGERAFNISPLGKGDINVASGLQYRVPSLLRMDGELLVAMTDRYDHRTGRDFVLRQFETSFEPGIETLEEWRLHHFGSTENTGTGADTADHDLDGLPNLLEFATQRNPLASDTVIDAAHPSDVFEWSYLRPLGASDEITYTVEWTHNIVDPTWTSTNVTQEEVYIHDNVMCEERATVPINGPRCFFRLRVDRQETTEP